MIIYNKLVRDRIPEIIAAHGQTYEVRVLEEDEYRVALNHKLREEMDEYARDEEIGELADLLEVIYALAAVKGVSAHALEDLRSAKRKDRGGFDQRLLLVHVTDGQQTP